MSTPRSFSKRIAFRVGAILVGILPLVLCELALRTFDWPRPTEIEDPYIGFDDVRPLFVRNEAEKRFEVAKERQVFFCPDSFEEQKSQGEFRVFCLGGSTVYGRPYQKETAFSTWLQRELEARQGDRSWRVINCGGVSYASYRLLPILKEVLQYEPDLIIVYTGHNEFLEERSYGDVRRSNRWLVGLHRRFSVLKSYQAVQNVWAQMRPVSKRTGTEPDQLSPEVDALLDYQQGLLEYQRDDDWHAGVEAHFEYNLQAMTAAANDANVPLMFVRPVANLASCPPFKSAFSLETSDADQRLIDERLQLPSPRGLNELVERRELLEEVVALDEHYALSHFRLAECCSQQGDFEQALRSFIRAKDEDICPLRMKEVMYESLNRVARENDVPVVDVRTWFEKNSDHGIVGQSWMLDHVHPKIDGHKKIAQLIAEEFERQGVIGSESGWQARRTQLFKANIESLEFGYFERGRQRLESLRLWTQGNAIKAKAKK